MNVSWRKTFRRGIVAALAAACAWWIFLPPPAAQVEAWYAKGIFPFLAGICVPIVDLAPFSVSVMLLVAALLLAVSSAVKSWRGGRREGAPRRRILLGWLEALVSTAVILYALFVLLWGAGYRRPRLADRLGLEVRAPQEEDVRSWIDDLGRVLRRDVPPPPERDRERALASLRRSLGRVIGEWDGREPRLPERVKMLPAGWLLAFGVSGVTTPILEAHCDGGDAEPAFLWERPTGSGR